MGTMHVKLLALAAIFAMSIGCTSGDVVTVSPSTPNGWSWTAANGGVGFFSNGGPALDEGAPFKQGSGAFYGYCGYEGDDGIATPSSVWLGTDQHASRSLVGIPLSAIKEMTYSTYVSRNWTETGGGGDREYPCEPFMLTLTVYQSPTNLNRRQFWHRPWGPGVAGNSGGGKVGIWQNWDATVDGLWYCDWLGWTGTWDQLLAAFPDAVLVPTSTTWNDAGNRAANEWKSVGYGSDTNPHGDPRSTGTGTCLNFWVGARKSITNIFGGSYSWWRESVGFRGYVDNFTLGVDFNGNGEVDADEEATYNFESDQPAPEIVALNNGACWDRAINNPSHKFRFKVFGMVLADPAPTTDTFCIWDGSYVQSSWTDNNGVTQTATERGYFEVRAPNINRPYSEQVTKPGSYVSAVGRPEIALGFSPHTPKEFYSSVSNIKVLYAPAP